MNHYELKQEERRERLFTRAGKVRTLSNQLYTSGTTALQAIPFGQPILVGHYSERADRNYRGRAVRKIDKSFELAETAESLERRAETLGTHGISSDDPDAVKKLESRVASLRAHQEVMRRKNIDARKAGESKMFPTYMLSNNNANIRRIEQRIKDLQRNAEAPLWGPFVAAGILCEEHRDNNRIVFKFREIPSYEMRQLLKRYAFKWSPSRGLWVRQATGNAKFAAEQLFAALKHLCYEE